MLPLYDGAVPPGFDITLLCSSRMVTNPELARRLPAASFDQQTPAYRFFPSGTGRQDTHSGQVNPFDELAVECKHFKAVLFARCTNQQGFVGISKV